MPRAVQQRARIVGQPAVGDHEPAPALGLDRHDAVERAAGAGDQRPARFDRQPQAGSGRAAGELGGERLDVERVRIVGTLRDGDPAAADQLLDREPARGARGAAAASNSSRFAANGASSEICDPMCACRPISRSCGSSASRSKASGSRSSAIPNFVFSPPVRTKAWV